MNIKEEVLKEIKKMVSFPDELTRRRFFFLGKAIDLALIKVKETIKKNKTLSHKLKKHLIRELGIK